MILDTAYLMELNRAPTRPRPRIRPSGLSGVGPRKLIRDWSQLTPDQRRIALAYGASAPKGLGRKGPGRRNDPTHVDVGPITRRNRGAKAIEAAALRQEALHVQSEVKRGKPIPATPLLKAHAEATGAPIVIPPAKNAPGTPSVAITPKVTSQTPIIVNVPAPSGDDQLKQAEQPPEIVRAMAQPSPVFDSVQTASAPSGDDDPYAQGDDDPYAQGDDPYGYGPWPMQGLSGSGLGLKLGKVLKKITRYAGKNALPIASGVASSVLTGGASLPAAVLRAGRTIITTELNKALNPQQQTAAAPRPVMPRPVRRFAPVRQGPPAPAPESSSAASSWLVPAAIGAAVLLLARD